MRLEGKAAIVSGGAQGIGAEASRLLAREGASVAIGDLREDRGRDVEARVLAAGGSAMFVLLDVTSEKSWRRAIDSTVERFGRLDILVNNAAIAKGGSIEETSPDVWDEVMEVNAKGVFLGTKLAIPEMRKAGRGSIINISSQIGIVGSDRGSISYHAAKGAVRSLTKSAALMCAKENIRVNSVHPGTIRTSMNEDRLRDPAEVEWTISKIPLCRIGMPEDVAHCVVFLASDESSYMTGAELVVDGGWTAQ